MTCLVSSLTLARATSNGPTASWPCAITPTKPMARQKKRCVSMLCFVCVFCGMVVCACLSVCLCVHACVRACLFLSASLSLSLSASLSLSLFLSFFVSQTHPLIHPRHRLCPSSKTFRLRTPS